MHAKLLKNFFARLLRFLCIQIEVRPLEFRTVWPLIFVVLFPLVCMLTLSLGMRAAATKLSSFPLLDSLSLALFKTQEECQSGVSSFPSFDLMREGEESSNPMVEIRIAGW
jgi:hypothetical protein